MALLEGWPLSRGISDAIIHSLFSEIVALYKGWPLVRVATYRGTTVYPYGYSSLDFYIFYTNKKAINSVLNGI